MRTTNTILAASLALALTACASNDADVTTEVKAQATEMQANLNNTDLFEVHWEGRVYVFDDMGTYNEFLEVGETSYHQTFIGAGPDGQTLVFGMTSEDKKKHYSQIAAYNLYMGTLPAAEDFYGEMRIEGRIYVFDKVEDMKTVRSLGEAPLRYSDIGSGPNGETVVYVLRSDNKKKKPEALIERFKKHNHIKAQLINNVNIYLY